MNARLRRAPRRRGPEPLEERLAMDGSAAPLGGDAYLTLSFAPDGAVVAGRPNELAATFAALGTTGQWQDAILRAFQTWAISTNADIGLVADSGAPFGTAGATRDDSRFGDIRIAGVAMPPEVGAISVPIDSAVSGTWHADVVFNTAFPYESLDDVFAIALHEAGNVLGLKDNNDPDSPLRAGPIPTATVPTANDIAALQALHGARAADINELDDDNQVERNDTRATATEWEPGGDGVPAGSLPALAQGDIESASDIDYFELEVPDGYAGPVTITLRTDGVSLLRPSLLVESASGAPLGTATGTGDRGSRVSVTLPSVTGGQSVFVRPAGSPGAGLFAVGGYSLTAVFDAANTVSAAAIEAASDARIRGVEIDDLQELFEAGEDLFRADLGANDTLASATPLVAAAGFPRSAHYATVATVETVGDVDFYRVERPLDGADFAFVQLRSLNVGRLVPWVTAVDALGAPVASRVLVNGAGELLLEVDSTGLVGDLFLRVAASDSAGPFQRGAYSLAVGFAGAPQALTTFADGTLATASAVAEQTLYAAEPQLFHFVLQTTGTAAAGSTAVFTEVRDASGATVYSVASPVGESRSAGAVFLPTGEYTVRVTAVALGDTLSAPLSYALRGAPFSDPFVGDGSDPTTNPFDCGGSNEGFFCYPGGIVSSDPFLWDDFVGSLAQSPIPGDTPGEIRRLLGDWWSWVWAQLGVNGPPLAQSDDFTGPSASQGQAPPETPAPSDVAPVAFAQGPRNVLANDVEPESDPVVAVLVSPARRGAVTVSPDGEFTYTPSPGFVGFDSFRYASFDFIAESNPATVWVSASGSVGLTGDYNGDRVVNSADRDFWRANYGESGGPADGNRDGIVDAADYTIWRDNLGAVAPAVGFAPAAVAAPPLGPPPVGPPPVVAPLTQAPPPLERAPVDPAPVPPSSGLAVGTAAPAASGLASGLTQSPGKSIDPPVSRRTLLLLAAGSPRARDEALADWPERLRSNGAAPAQLEGLAPRLRAFPRR